VQQRWPERGTAWADQVEDELDELCLRHGATPVRVLPARYGFVVAATSPHGPIVIRSTPDPHGPEQTAVAVALAGLGIAPAVHDYVTTDHGTWTVLDQVQPGTPLAEADPSTVTVGALVAPLAAMNGQPAPLAGMPSITDWLRSRLEDDDLAELPPGGTVAPASQRRAALRVLDDLAYEVPAGLCHGDASTWNVLTDGPSGWKFIDPRGVTGETAYDVAVLAFKISRYVPTLDLAETFAKTADVDADRVRDWIVVADAARV
jgi:streptomycin 6-kinase